MQLKCCFDCSAINCQTMLPWCGESALSSLLENQRLQTTHQNWPNRLKKVHSRGICIDYRASPSQNQKPLHHQNPSVTSLTNPGWLQTMSATPYHNQHNSTSPTKNSKKKKPPGQNNKKSALPANHTPLHYCISRHQLNNWLAWVSHMDSVTVRRAQNGRR